MLAWDWKYCVQEFIKLIKTKDKLIRAESNNGECSEQCIPPIRTIFMAHDAQSTNKTTNINQTQRIASTDYGKWDKFDAGENGIYLNFNTISIDAFRSMQKNKSRYGMFKDRRGRGANA